jgi:hypothetical protein
MDRSRWFQFVKNFCQEFSDKIVDIISFFIDGLDSEDGEKFKKKGQFYERKSLVTQFQQYFKKKKNSNSNGKISFKLNFIFC